MTNKYLEKVAESDYSDLITPAKPKNSVMGSGLRAAGSGLVEGQVGRFLGTVHGVGSSVHKQMAEKSASDNQYLSKIATIIDMSHDASGALSKVTGIGHQAPALLSAIKPAGMGLGRKLGIGAGILGAGALVGGLMHRSKQDPDNHQ